MTNSYTQEDVHSILLDYRILRAKIDTVRIKFILSEPAQRKTIERLTGAKGYGLEFCPETRRLIRGGHCWRHWMLSFQDPTPETLLEAFSRVHQHWGINNHHIRRIDVAFDAKRKGVRKDLPVPDDLVLLSARHDLMSVYLSCLVPLKPGHDWRVFSREGEDGNTTSTHYLGHKMFDFFRVYDKLVDQRQALAPVDRVARLELCLRPQTVSHCLGISTIEDFVAFDQWRRVLGLVQLVDRHGYSLRELRDRMGKALDRLSQHWKANRQRWEHTGREGFDLVRNTHGDKESAEGFNRSDVMMDFNSGISCKENPAAHSPESQASTPLNTGYPNTF